jgi:cell wall assembly regulator SMI1
MTDTEIRTERFEQALGQALPAEYRAFLLTHVENPGRSPQVISTNPEYWDLRSLFDLKSSSGATQVDSVYRLVSDVLPDGLIPVGDDSGGNLYLLDIRPQAGGGAVYRWDHEQDLGENHVEKVADSFGAFLGLLIADEAG